VTAAEVYELTTQGGTTDFALAVEACNACGAWCLIGGLAVNTYVEPVYTVDADLVMVLSRLSELGRDLSARGFKVDEHPHSLNAQKPGSQLRIQFTTDPRYQPFLGRSGEALVLGIPVRVACLEDTTQGKLWAYSDPKRRFSKRKKDELDLIRLAEEYPRLRSLYPPELLDIIDKG
jgi:hypothetical protein